MLQNYILELDGKPAGRFFNFKGGSAEADVVSESGGSGSFPHKHIGGVKYQDMVLTCGAGMSRNFYQWIASNMDGENVRKNGAIVALDNRQVPVARLEFSQALITSLALPSLDRSGRDAASMVAVIRPEITRSKTADSSGKPGVYASALPKAWSISDFQLTISGLETDCKHVTQIDSLRLGLKLNNLNMGNSLSTILGSTDYSDLAVRLPQVYATGFYQWLEDFVVKGNNGPQSEKTGVLEFFAPNSSKSYFELELSGLGIYKIVGPSGLHQNTSHPVTVGMYCERMKFRAGASSIM